MIRIAVSADLLVDAQRDLKDIGCADLAARTKNITELPYGKIRLEEGVIFSTYSALCTKSKSGGTRLDQIIGWLGGKAISALEIAPRPISSDLIRSHPISSDLTIWSISAPAPSASTPNLRPRPTYPSTHATTALADAEATPAFAGRERLHPIRRVSQGEEPFPRESCGRGGGGEGGGGGGRGGRRRAQGARSALRLP